MNPQTSSSPEDRQPAVTNEDIFPLSEMIPGIVHNISNPLTIIKVRSQILQNKMPDSPVFPAMLDNVAKIEDILGNLAERITNLQNPEIRPISLKNLVMTEIKYLEADLNFKHKIIKKIDLQESQPFIKAIYKPLSCGLLTAVSALVRLMESAPVRTLGIAITYRADQIYLRLTATTAEFDDEAIRFFEQLKQTTIPDRAHEIKSPVTPEIHLMMRSYFCFKPYISEFNLSRNSNGELECLIIFPTGN